MRIRQTSPPAPVPDDGQQEFPFAAATAIALIRDIMELEALGELICPHCAGDGDDEVAERLRTLRQRIDSANADGQRRSLAEVLGGFVAMSRVQRAERDRWVDAYCAALDRGMGHQGAILDQLLRCSEVPEVYVEYFCVGAPGDMEAQRVPETLH